MERHGRFIRMLANRTEKEQRELVAAVARNRPKLKDEMDELAEKLQSTLAKYDAINMIANFALVNVSYDPETYKEYMHEGRQPYVEYVALLYLKQTYQPREPTFVGKDEIQEVSDLAEKIFNDTTLYFVTEHIDPNHVGPLSRADDLRRRTIMYELTVRNPAYYHHEVDLLRGLFTLHANWMEQRLGFTIEDAIKLTESMPEMAMDKFYERRDQGKKDATEVLRAVARYKNGAPSDARLPNQLVEQLSTLSRKRLKERVLELQAAWLFSNLGSTWSTGAQDLADRTGISLGRTQKFLDLLSISFGSVGQDFTWPTLTHELQKTPIICWNDKYMLPIPNLLVQHLRANLENRGKEDRQFWEVYQSNRSDYLEEQSLILLSRALGGCKYYLNLKYPNPDSTRGGETELDGLILFDDKLFLVECRASALSPAARRGAPSIEEDLLSIVVQAHDQALRARDYIRMKESPCFELPGGEQVILDRAALREIFMVTVSLDSLTVFTPVLHEVADLGIFSSTELPWAVCLTDLRVISELCEFPSMFVHFLKRRLQINRVKKVHANDELDWFGHYLAEGLNFGTLLSSGIDEAQLLSYTVQMDDYYLYEMGERTTPTRKPSQNMPLLLRRVVDRLERERPRGFSEAICLLLDMSKEEREQFERSFHRIRKQASRTGELAEFSIGLGNTGEGITILASAVVPSLELEALLLQRAQTPRQETASQRWLFLANHVDKSDLPIAMLIDGPSAGKSAI
jgi:hypothetical protein